jgi:transketolase
MQTTQDIIRIVPFQADFKSDLLGKYDTLTDDQRFAIERIVWDFYDALYEVRLQENMQVALERAKKNEEKLDHEFYNRVRAQTEKQLQEEFSKTETSIDLSGTREALAKILQQDEIR